MDGPTARDDVDGDATVSGSALSSAAGPMSGPGLAPAETGLRTKMGSAEESLQTPEESKADALGQLTAPVAVAAAASSSVYTGAAAGGSGVIAATAAAAAATAGTARGRLSFSDVASSATMSTSTSSAGGLDRASLNTATKLEDIVSEYNHLLSSQVRSAPLLRPRQRALPLLTPRAVFFTPSVPPSPCPALLSSSRCSGSHISRSSPVCEPRTRPRCGTCGRALPKSVSLSSHIGIRSEAFPSPPLSSRWCPCPHPHYLTQMSSRVSKLQHTRDRAQEGTTTAERQLKSNSERLRHLREEEVRAKARCDERLELMQQIKMRGRSREVRSFPLLPQFPPLSIV